MGRLGLGSVITPASSDDIGGAEWPAAILVLRGRGAVGRREAGRMRKGNAWREMRLTKGGMCMSGKKCGLVTVLTEVDAKYVALTF